MSRLRVVIISLVVLLIGSGITAALWPTRSNTQKIPELITAVAELGPLKETITATGTIVPRTQVQITCKASGRVVELPVQSSSVVKKGDLLFQLNPDEEQRRVGRAQVDLEGAQARAEQAKLALAHEEESVALDRDKSEAELKSEEISTRDAQERAARMRALKAKGLASAEEAASAEVQAAAAVSSLENARMALRSIDARSRMLESKRRDVTLAEAQVKTESLNLADAQERLSDTRVVSPINGTITQVSIDIGQLIASAISTVGAGGTPVMTVVDMASLQVRVYALEMDVGRIRLGQRADIVTDAYPGRVFTGAVSRIAAAGSRPKAGAAGGDQSVTFEIIVTLDPCDMPLRPEMTATVDITTIDVEKTLLIPVGAVRRQGLKTQVIVRKKDGTRDTRTITLGGTDGVKQQVLAGLEAGDVVEVGKGTSRWRNDFDVGIK